MNLKIKIDKDLGNCKAEKDVTSNARLKSFKHVDILQIANKPIFKVEGFEERKESKKLELSEVEFEETENQCTVSKTSKQRNEESIISAKIRAKSSIRAIALMNDFEYMFTWTLNGDLVDRFNPEEVYKKVRAFLSNATQRKGFKYVLIPEHHKNKAIHFHGLCILGEVKIEPALTSSGEQRVTNSGRPVFNMKDWTLGFSTVVPLDEKYLCAVNYVSKYITKADEKIFGKYYLSSRDLEKKPTIYILEDLTFKDAESLGESFISQYETSPYKGLSFLSTEFDKDCCIVYNKDGEVLN